MKPLLVRILAVAPNSTLSQVGLTKALVSLIAARPAIPTDGLSVEVWSTKIAACIRTALGHLRRLKQNNTKWRQAVRFMAAKEVAELKSLFDMASEVQWSHATTDGHVKHEEEEKEEEAEEQKTLNIWDSEFDLASAASLASKPGGLKAMAGSQRSGVSLKRTRFQCRDKVKKVCDKVEEACDKVEKGEKASDKVGKDKGGDKVEKDGASVEKGVGDKLEEVGDTLETPKKRVKKAGDKKTTTPEKRRLPESPQLGTLHLSVGSTRSELCASKGGVRTFVIAIRAKKTKFHTELAHALVTFATNHDVTKEELRHMAQAKADESANL